VIFPACDVAALSEKLQQLADPALRARLAAAGAARAAESFSAERFCEAYARLYDDLLGPARK
jgi:glycosyltransferase involved in cell wall biosynthesis